METGRHAEVLAHVAADDEHRHTPEQAPRDAAALEIPRDNKMGRLMWFAKNFQAFGAPVLMLIHTPRYMGPPQWSDVGMYMQTVMLLAREHGLHTCAQEIWSLVPGTVGQFLEVPSNLMLFAGMALGHADLTHRRRHPSGR